MQDNSHPRFIDRVQGKEYKDLQDTLSVATTRDLFLPHTLIWNKQAFPLYFFATIEYLVTIRSNTIYAFRKVFFIACPSTIQLNFVPNCYSWFFFREATNCVTDCPITTTPFTVMERSYGNMWLTIQFEIWVSICRTNNSVAQFKNNSRYANIISQYKLLIVSLLLLFQYFI